MYEVGSKVPGPSTLPALKEKFPKNFYTMLTVKPARFDAIDRDISPYSRLHT